MRQSNPTAFRLQRLRKPYLDKTLRTKLSEFNLTDLVEPSIGPDHWPVGHEIALNYNFTESLPVISASLNTLSLFGVDFEPRCGFDFADRPPSELGAYFVWHCLEQAVFEVDALAETNRILGGSKRLRRGVIGTTQFKSGHKVLFDCATEPEAFLHEWLSEFCQPCSQQHVLERAIWLFLDFLIGHPFTDGNGRTARLLFQAFLHTKGFLSAPLLPIGPCIIANEQSYLDALWAWEFLGNATVFYEFMFSIVKTTKEMSGKQLKVNKIIAVN